MTKKCSLFYTQLYNLFKKTVNQGWSQEHFNSVDSEFSKACCIHSIDKQFVITSAYTD